MKESVTFSASAALENRFWLQVMGDHARFILGALQMQEREEAARAMNFVQRMDSLLEQARKPLSDSEWQRLSQEAYEQAWALRAFKLHLLQRQLTESALLRISPSFLNVLK